MEYIDNSIDSAEEFFDFKEHTYTKSIIVTVIFKNKSVIIKDNCFGITDLVRVVQNIGNSQKKEQPWTNGQFGLGMLSSVAACEQMEIISKNKEKQNAQKISINRNLFDCETVADFIFPDLQDTDYSYSSGTKIILSRFDKNMWKQIDFEEVKREVERHFELLLYRKNIQIKLVDDRSGEEYICQPFNYNQYTGEIYENKITELHYMEGRRHPKPTKIIITKPINVFIKVTKGKVIERPPVFIVKGRRIAEIKDIKQFRSKHKSDIWGHPSITGFIDLSDYLEPTLARNDFKNNNKSKALFTELERLEPLILEVIQDANKETEARHYQALEDKLNNALSALAKIDSMNFRTEYASGDHVNLQGDGSGQSMEEDHGAKDRGNEGSGSGGNGWGGENEGAGIGPSGKAGNDMPDEEQGGDMATNKEADNPFEDSEFKGSEKRKSGFNIKFVDGEIIDESTHEPIRSQLIDGTIRIFKNHKDFQGRVDTTRAKEPKISQRLITYLAGEITVHYKDKLQTRNGQPEYNKRLFENLVEFIYQFEEMVSDLAGRNLSSLDE